MVWVEGEVLPQITVIYLTTRKQNSVDQKMKRHTMCHVRTTIPVVDHWCSIEKQTGPEWASLFPTMALLVLFIKGNGGYLVS